MVSLSLHLGHGYERHTNQEIQETGSSANRGELSRLLRFSYSAMCIASQKCGITSLSTPKRLYIRSHIYIRVDSIKQGTSLYHIVAARKTGCYVPRI